MNDKKTIRIAIISILILLLAACPAVNNNFTEISKQPTAWVQSELTETYMRRISKNECLYKTVSFLKKCDSHSCLEIMASTAEDCLTYAEGSIAEFCVSYDTNFTDTNCTTGLLSKRACKVIKISKPLQCK